ncbi:MAG: DUF72 domain-containing protein [Chloroflexota bacterium]|nr:DUF72 domain-containing protein [Chloroflexota bacterium]
MSELRVGTSGWQYKHWAVQALEGTLLSEGAPNGEVARALSFLRRRNIALVIGDTPRWPTHIAVTSDLVYLRFHGPERLYASEYSDEALRVWADRILGWRGEGRDVFAYFNNDEMGYAPKNALHLRELASD